MRYSGPAERRPDVRASAGEAALGRDLDLAVRMQGLADQGLREIRTVGIGGVDEIDPEVGQALQRPDRLVPVFRRAPHALADDAHGAEAKPVDIELPSDAEASGLRCVGHEMSSDVGAAQGQRASGGMEERMEAMLPPVFRPKMVPRS